MLDRRAYRAGFAPVLAAIVLLAFSLRGEPEPLEPAAGTIEFDAEMAAAAARELMRAAPDRAPGTEGAATAADWVAERFEGVASGAVAEQAFEAQGTELRNVLLTLRGTNERAILVLAERASGDGPGVPASAAATGVLVELAAELGVTDRERTLILASIDGGSAVADGVRELVGALPESQELDAAVVITQPGAAALREPHLITSSASSERPSLELIRTAEESLAARAQVSAGLEGALGQIARLALPAAAGAQGALVAEGVDAVAISAAGEVPLKAEESGQESFDVESVQRFGAATLALVGALDARPPGAPAPSAYVRVGTNTVPGWVLSLLAIALLIPPALPVALKLAASRRDGSAGRAMGWALEWTLVGLAPLAALLVLAFVGLIPSPEPPYDPGAFGIGATEVLALILLAGIGAAAWWVLGLRRAPALPSATLGAAAGAVCLAACLLAWIANPFLALALAPLAHVVVVHATGRRRSAALAVPAAVLAFVPIALAVLHVAAELDWGVSAPWQLVVLVAGGSVGLLSAVATAAALVATVAVVHATRTPGSRVGAGAQAPPRVRP